MPDEPDFRMYTRATTVRDNLVLPAGAMADERFRANTVPLAVPRQGPKMPVFRGPKPVEPRPF